MTQEAVELFISAMTLEPNRPRVERLLRENLALDAFLLVINKHPRIARELDVEDSLAVIEALEQVASTGNPSIEQVAQLLSEYLS